MQSYIVHDGNPVVNVSSSPFGNQPIPLYRKRRPPCRRSSAIGNRKLAPPPIYHPPGPNDGFYTCYNYVPHNWADLFEFVYVSNRMHCTVSCSLPPPLSVAVVVAVRSVRSTLAPLEPTRPPLKKQFKLMFFQLFRLVNHSTSIVRRSSFRFTNHIECMHQNFECFLSTRLLILIGMY